MNTTVTGWRRWLPTDKWVGTFFVGVGGIVSSWVASGQFDQPERTATASLIPALIAAYFITNKDRFGQKTSE